MFYLYENIGFERILNKVRKENCDIILFGAGSYGQNTFLMLKHKGLEKNIRVFCDNDEKKWGDFLFAREVINCEESKKRYPNAMYIICSTYYKEIITQLNELGEENYYVVPLQCLRYSREWYELMDKASDDMISKWKNINNETDKIKINKVRNILNDEESTEVYDNIIKFRNTKDYSYIDEIYDNNVVQYFDPSIFNLSEEEIFLDCGAWNGDTIQQFIKVTYGKYRDVVSFEPTLKQYEQIVNMIEKEKLKNIKVYNLAVWNCKDKLNFNVNEDSSKIDYNGNDQVNADALDNILESVPVTFIKMDIEGAEKQALLGAKNIIKKYKPKLAISVYHKPEDIYEIPLLIKEIVPEYKLYLRHHSEFQIETVCYAVL